MVNTEPATQASAFEFSGGALCLDFVNTLGDRPRRSEELLGNYFDLLRWAETAGLVDQAEGRRLERQAGRQAARAGRAFDDAIRLRERLYGIFSALAAEDRPQSGELAALNVALGEALPHLRLEQRDGRFRWHWAGAAHRLDRLLWPVTRSAAELLTSSEVALVRECASDRCSWMFIDRSRTHRRRWCDMKTCGNRAKARRHYERRKQRSLAGSR